MGDRHHGRRRRLAPALLGALLSTLFVGDARAQEPTDGDLEQQLAERFVPVMMLKEQPEPCSDEGEPYGPTDVEILLDNPEIALRQVGRSDPTVTRGATAADLYRLGEGFYLDFPGSSLSPGCIFERDFDKYAEGVPATVYAHVVQPDSEPGAVYLQYWFYWYYNDWNNKHESDWEGITLKFEAGSVAEALAGTPIGVGYSQHEGGERADWGDDKLERDGDRPVVYSSSGSHASYFGSALYLGRSASEGFGCDDTSGPSVRVDPEVIVLPDSVDDPADEFAWLEFRGRWGERQEGPFNGPTGPSAKERWLEPTPWFEELRGTSVVIPAGDSGVVSVIDLFCNTVEAGSGALIAFTVSPARVVIALLAALGLAVFVVRRTSWERVDGRPVVARRRAGQILRLAGRSWLQAPLAFLLFGLVYIPAVVAAGAIGAVLQWLPLVGDLLSLAGSTSGTNLLFAVFASSLATVAGFAAVNVMTAHYFHRTDGGMEGAVDAVRAAWERRRAVIGAIVRSYLIVAVLLLTVIGLPWAVRQVVRYQFVGQEILLGDCDGAEALERSSEVVRGRWWHTLVVTAVLNGTIGLVGAVVGMLVLVLVAGLPLWAFSGLLSLVTMLFVPLASIAMTYLHADAMAEQQEQAHGASEDDPQLVG